MSNISKLKTAIAELRQQVKHPGSDPKLKEELRKLENALMDAQHKAAIEKLVGVERGVIIGLAFNPALRGKRATVVKVKRTRASVIVGGEDWEFPLDLIRVDPHQVKLEFMLNGCNAEVESE